MRNRRYIWTLAAVLAGVLLAWLTYRIIVPGIQVIVMNAGSDPLRDVVVHVTGASYPIGVLNPGESRTIGVRPTSESHVEIEFTDVHGSRARLNAGGYFEPGYHVTIRVVLKNGQIESMEQGEMSIY